MDWYEIVVLIVFFGLPLLEKFFQGMRKGTPPTRDPEGEGAREPSPLAELEEAAEEDGDAGWGEALPPPREPELPSEPEYLSAREARPEPAYLPEAERASVRVVSMEPLVVDRAVEHARLHRGTTLPAGPRRPPRAASYLATQVGTREELRRAIILSEVLGRPRSEE